MNPSASTILKNLPRYLWGYVIGLLLALVNDFVLTSILFAGIASGFWLGIAAGFAIFFILYVFLRVIGNISEAIGYGLRGAIESSNVLAPPTSAQDAVTKDYVDRIEVVERDLD